MQKHKPMFIWYLYIRCRRKYEWTGINNLAKASFLWNKRRKIDKPYMILNVRLVYLMELLSKTNE